MIKLLALFLIFFISCAPLVEDSFSAPALAAGNKNVFLGSDACKIPIEKGYAYCAVTRGSKVPDLKILFLNQGAYGVSDCRLGLFKTGTTKGPEEVKLDLSPLSKQLEEDGFCILKIEAIERYPDPKDPNQFREIPIGGIFFLEALAPGYIPSPPKSAIGWCAKVGRTTKGRTYLKVLDAEDCD